MQQERCTDLPGVRCNAQLPGAALRKYCRMTPKAQQILRAAFERLGYSARAYDRILRVARTIADLDGSEQVDIIPSPDLKPQSEAKLVITRANGQREEVSLILRIDTPIEVDYYRSGGILPFVLRQLLN